VAVQIERVRAWIEEHAGSRVVALAPITGGGITNTKWIVRLAGGDRLVLRWADPEAWGATGREHVRREALACRLLAGSGLPVPSLLAEDPDGSATGGPAELLSRLPGRTRYDPLGPAAIEALAAVAVAVHRHPVALENRPPAFAFRGPAEPQVPDWSTRPALWRAAIDRFLAGRSEQAAAPTTYVLVHRDFHLGNVLWAGDTVTGVVDWAETSWGPAGLDVAHMSSDFAMLYDLAGAEAFRSAYVGLGGRLDQDPAFWQLADIIGFLPDPAHILRAVSATRPDLTAHRIRSGLEDLAAATLG
jgi:aminoglycoside phosphotransferase (APT) family kinase protein